MSKWGDRIRKIDRLAERVADAPANLVGGGRAISDSAKKDLYEKGLDGVATVVKAPSKHRVSQVQANVGRFTVSVAIPGEQPYEANAWQEFMFDEWKAMQPGMEVPCKIDPDDREKIWLTPVIQSDPAKQAKGVSIDLGAMFRKRGG